MKVVLFTVVVPEALKSISRPLCHHPPSSPTLKVLGLTVTPALSTKTEALRAVSPISYDLFIVCEPVAPVVALTIPLTTVWLPERVSLSKEVLASAYAIASAAGAPECCAI